MKLRKRQGYTKGVACPGSLYELDCATGDVCLVNANRNLRLGRPLVYLASDLWTRLNAGFHVADEHSFNSAAKLALWNAYREKVGFSATQGVAITPEDWPSQGLPAALACRAELFREFSDECMTVAERCQAHCGST